jgi:hypothetical protein
MKEERSTDIDTNIMVQPIKFDGRFWNMFKNTFYEDGQVKMIILPRPSEILREKILTWKIFTLCSDIAYD